MKKHVVRVALGLLVVCGFVGHAAGWYAIPLLRQLENLAYDARVRLTMPGGIDDRVVIVDIDEKSLAVEGQWPWHRHRLAALLDRLFDQYKVKAVGFDVVFAERDDTSGLSELDRLAHGELKGNASFQSALKSIVPSLQYDRRFAEAMRGRPVILGYSFTVSKRDDRPGVPGNDLPPPVFPAGFFKGRNLQFESYRDYAGNLPELLQAAAAAGHFNPDPDEDGVTRRVPMLAEFAGAYYEPLSLAIIRVLQGSPALQARFADPTLAAKRYPGLEWLVAGQAIIPVDETATALVPYRDEEHSFPYVSASDVLQGKLELQDTKYKSTVELEGRIVLVGTTAPGLNDLRSTPLDPVYPGVEIHANLIAGMLDGSIRHKPAYVSGAQSLLLVLLGGTLALVLPLLNPLRASLLASLALCGLFGLNLWAWTQAQLVLPLADGALAVAALFALNMSYGFFVESRAKRQITGRFGQYVPPELVDEMSQNPDHFSMEGESREMSVLFTDVRGFTTISEGLDPKQLTQLMNEFLTPLTRVIYRHRGTIDKYMGDCIMAFWGAPMSDAQHARNAVLAGLEMQSTMDALQPQFKMRGWPELHIGVGVNSGRMSVGNMGSEIRVAYTVMGDAVNLASRLEGLTKQYGVGMLVGETTRAMVSDVVFRELDRVRVKGKNEPVAIFEPLGPAHTLDQSRQDELALWHQALRLYRTRDWDRAELQLINLQQRFAACVLYSVFLQRIVRLRAEPPGPDWDGAWTFESK